MIEYRTYRNDDPPRLLALWNESQFGRGGATDIPLELLDQLLFSQPFFDHRGLIVAADGERLLGMAHAGFGCREDGQGLSHEDGVVCQLIVHPDSRRQGIGRALLGRAVNYLHEKGATQVHAGPGPGRDPFYCGLYGGSEAAGFLATDEGTDEFLQACGFEPVARFCVFQRQLKPQSTEVVDYESLQWKRRTRLEISPQWDGGDWWWNTRFGRLDYVRFALINKADELTLASLTLVGLDQYTHKWTTRGIGLADILVDPDHRRQGLGRLLVTETLRRLRQESISVAEAHAASDDAPLTGLLVGCGFRRIDAGTQYCAVDP